MLDTDIYDAIPEKVIYYVFVCCECGLASTASPDGIDARMMADKEGFVYREGKVYCNMCDE
jgi:hypothetical protein